MFYSFLKAIFTTSLCLFLVFGIAFSFTGQIGGAVSAIRSIDGGLGLLNTPLTESQKNHRESINQSLLNGGVQAEALVSGATAAAILAAIQNWLVNTIASLIKTVIQQILNFIRDKITEFIDKAFKFLDDFIAILEKLAEFLSATRVGIGFLAYRSLQSDTNVLSSRAFALSLIRETNDRMDGFGDFIGERGENVIIDAVTWLDFMSVQKELQADTMGLQGLVESTLNSANINIMGHTLNINLDQYNNVRNGLMFVLAGVSCDNRSMINTLGAFAPTYRDASSCLQAVRSSMSGVLSQRENQMRNLARVKTKTLEDRAPANCRLRSSINYTGNTGIRASAGQLDVSILEIASQVEFITPTPEECEVASTGNREKREVSQRKAIESAIGGSGIGAAGGQGQSPIGDFFEDIFNFFLEELENMFGDIFRGIEERFNRIGELFEAIISNNNIGLQVILFNISVGTGHNITNRLKTLSREIQQQLRNEGGFPGRITDGFDVNEFIGAPIDVNTVTG